jgi:hypothetical protein
MHDKPRTRNEYFQPARKHYSADDPPQGILEAQLAIAQAKKSIAEIDTRLAVPLNAGLHRQQRRQKEYKRRLAAQLRDRLIEEQVFLEQWIEVFVREAKKILLKAGYQQLPLAA